MDEKARFALKRDIIDACRPGPRCSTDGERVETVWRFARERGVSIAEVFGEMPEDAAEALVRSAQIVLEDWSAYEDPIDREHQGLISGYLPGEAINRHNPGFISRSYIEALAGRGEQDTPE